MIRIIAAIVALAAIGCVLNASSAQAVDGPKVLPTGHVFFHADFEGSEPFNGIAGEAALSEGFQGGKTLYLKRQEGAAGNSAVVTIDLPAEAMRGYMVDCSAMVKAAAVSNRPAPWNGVKFMLAIETPAGRQWPQTSLSTGSFDWQLTFMAMRIPADATRVRLILGLEEVTGEVWFDNIRVSVRKPPLPPPPAEPPTGPVFKGHNLPRLRGAMVDPGIDEEGLRTLGRQWNANVIRWQLVHYAPPGQTLELDKYDQWLEGELKKLDAVLPLCEQHGLLVVIDLHSPPGGRSVGGYAAANDRLFIDRACQDKFVEVWQQIAERYRNAPAVWGYDLVNEPDDSQLSPHSDDWQDLAERAAKAIRAIDREKAIIVQPANGGGPEGMAVFRPIDMPNVVYSVHMYHPHAFTHQGVYAASEPINYPGEIGGERWDKDRLEKALAPVIEFQKNYNVHIFVGEFSAIRWAPGDSAHRYLSDLIEIFEHHGWDWAYHAFREWEGWSVEHVGDRNNTARPAEPTDRQKLLQHWFGKNEKPAPPAR